MSESSRNKMQAVLAYINEYNAEYGYSPTVREICAELNIKSTASAYYYIEKLKEEGYLSKSPNKNRAVNFKKSSSVNIPLIGTSLPDNLFSPMKITKIIILSLRAVSKAAISSCSTCRVRA